jgi:hypothetical protein
MPAQARGILWNQLILARALARLGKAMLERQPDGAEPPAFCYTDTHAGCGRLPGPLPLVDEVMVRRHGFAAQNFFDALAIPLPEGAHPGSWVLAGRVLGALGLAAEIDVNDLDAALVARARQHREEAWVRFWSHDWFLFLRSRLAMPRPPHFVFIDPPPDDARGPAYAIDAAILLDTLAVPYMISYPATSCQDAIDQIGRTGLELHLNGDSSGVLLGGGAETVVLDILPDLKLLAGLLGGSFVTRLPRSADYDI